MPFADPFDGGLRALVGKVGKESGVLGEEGGKVHESGLLICMGKSFAPSLPYLSHLMHSLSRR